MSTLLDSTLGVFEVAIVVGSLLLGIGILQAWHYSRTYGDDPWPLKLLVAAVILFDVVHSGLISHTLYHYTVTYYGNPAEFSVLAESLAVSVLISTTVAGLVQGFFTYRVFCLTQSRIFTGACTFLVLARLGTAYPLIPRALEGPTFAQFAASNERLILLNWSSGAAADILIAVLLCCNFLRSRTGFVGTDRLLDRLVLLTVATGTMTSVLTLVALVCLVTMPHNFLWLAFYLLNAKMFANSMLASLNSRRFVRATVNDSLDMRASMIYRTDRPNRRMTTLITAVQVDKLSRAEDGMSDDTMTET